MEIMKKKKGEAGGGSGGVDTEDGDGRKCKGRLVGKET